MNFITRIKSKFFETFRYMIRKLFYYVTKRKGIAYSVRVLGHKEGDKRVFENAELLKYNPKEKHTTVIVTDNYPYGGPFSVFLNYFRALVLIKDNPTCDIVMKYTWEVDFDKRDDYENFWILFFNTKPMSKGVYQSASNLVQLSGSGRVLRGDAFALFMNGNSRETGFQWLSGGEGKEYFKKAYSILQGRVEPSREVKEIIDCFFLKNNLRGKRIVALLLRENFTREFKDAMSAGSHKEILERHPETIGIREQFVIAREKMIEWNCEYIYISTIYSDSLEMARDFFEDRVLFMDRERLSYSEQMEKAFKEDLFAKSPEYLKNNNSGTEYLKKNTEYVAECFIMSEMTALIGGECSGTMGITLLNGGKFEHTLYFRNQNENKMIY